MTADLLTYEQAAERLGIGVTLTKNLVYSGELPAVRIGPRLRRIRPCDLEAYIDRGGSDGRVS